MLIKIQNLYKEFKTDDVVTKVLYNLDFEIKKGEFLAIMGPSGSGKSTLMNILGFLDKATSGEYIFNGENITKFNDDKLAHLRNNEIGFVFQQFNLLPRTSVLENVMLPLTYSKKIAKQDKIKKTTKAVHAVGLEHRINNLSNQLSGGEKQRVAIARALVNDPEIIFADEPTGNLDSKSGEQVMQILNNLNKQGKTIILVTHEQYTAEYAERIIKLKDGKIISDEKVSNRRQGGLVK
ncbi:MAG: ABC transporter ATP-binding protein [Patescibacteria group bacterium]